MSILHGIFRDCDFGNTTEQNAFGSKKSIII